jgi:hypothetical protein
MASVAPVTLPPRPHFGDETLGVAVYFSHPAGMVVRYREGTAFDGAVATFVSVQGDDALRQRFPGVPRFYFVEDFSGCVSYTTEARQVMTAWGKRIKESTVTTVVVPPAMSSVLRMGINTAIAVLNVAGVAIELADSLDEALERYGLRLA